MREPVQAAIDDWRNGKARFVVIGLLALDIPQLDIQSGLYLSSLGCDVTDENVSFAEEYNKQIERLVAQHGKQDWFPGVRLPSRTESLNLLQAGGPYETVLAKTCLQRDQNRQVAYIASQWKTPPAAALHNKVEHLFLLGGDINPRVGRIDIVDLKELRWMARYDFRRRYEPNFPWDQGARSGG